ncbi:hypothetical protein VKT23_006630 [Stygiomarasmius scandens]|uniref:Protein kinase domain-containing protein n=1 Tax=Marasmiellus scandens TaxID=2682957 RepID=A0ABR1JSR6_9AGAR
MESNVPSTPKPSPLDTKAPNLQHLTPQAQGTGSQQDHPQMHGVEDMRKYLQEDVADRVRIPLAEFLSVIMDVPENKVSKPDYRGDAVLRAKSSQKFQTAWESYRTKCAGNSRKEKTLYGPLVQVITVALDEMFTKHDLTFIDGHDLTILGSYAKRRPDLDAIRRSLVCLDNGALQKIKLSWPMLMYWLEVKHRRGCALDWTGGTAINLNVDDSDEEDDKDNVLPNISEPREIKDLPQRGSASSRRQTGSSSVVTALQSVDSNETNTSNPRKRKWEPALRNPDYTVRTRSIGLNASVPDNQTTAPSPDEHSTHSGLEQTQDSAPASPPGSTIDPKTNEGEAVNEEPKLPVFDDDEMDSDEEEQLEDTEAARLTKHQCAGYALEMLSSGLLRYHSVGIIVDSTYLQLAYYDRSKVVMSHPVNLEEDENLNHFLNLLYQLETLDGSKAGLFSSKADTHFPKIDPFNKNLINGDNASPPGSNAFRGCRLFLDAKTELELENVVYRAHGIIGRGSTVIKAKRIQGEWEDQEVIVKISFPGEGRQGEDELVAKAAKTAKDLGKDHAWAEDHLPTILWSETYQLDKNSPQSQLAEYLQRNNPDKPYEKRVLRITVQRILEPITNLTDPREYAQVFFDVLQIHRWLIDYPKILQRDISLANVMFYRKDDKTVRGVLNDFDLASELPLRGRSSQQRTGTKPYMSADLLDRSWARKHDYRHELEALFYVMLILCCHYKQYDSKIQQTTKLPFKSWFRDSPESIANEKTRWVTKSLSTVPTTSFFKAFKGNLANLKDQLHGGQAAKDTYSFQKRQHDKKVKQFAKIHKEMEPSPVFDWQTLGGHVSYETFKDIMCLFDDKLLVERYPDELVKPIEDSDFFFEA